jgi:hypothetical protein
MARIARRFCCSNWKLGVTWALLCLFFVPAFPPNSSAQGQKAPGAKTDIFNAVVKALPPGGPPPRLPDGHVDFTGRYYPNSGGRMLDSATPGHVDRAVEQNFDSRAEEKLSFKPGMSAKYMSPVPYGM